MANFFENYRAASQQIPFKGFRNTTFRDAENGEETTYQVVNLSKPNKRFLNEDEQYKYDESKNARILLIVPAKQKSAPFSTVRGYHSLTGNENFDEGVDLENESSLRNALEKNQPIIGLSKNKRSNQPDGEILGAIDDSGRSLTAKGTLDYLNQLKKQGYEITNFQEPEISYKHDDGYYPGDIFRRITGIAPPYRGEVYASLPSAKDNKDANTFIQNLRAGDKSFADLWYRSHGR